MKRDQHTGDSADLQTEGKDRLMPSFFSIFLDHKYSDECTKADFQLNKSEYFPCYVVLC